MTGGLRLFTASELAAQVVEDAPASVRGLIYDGVVTLIEGKVKVGKTDFALLACRAIMDGKPFLGQATTQRPVVYLTEQPRASFIDKLTRFGLRSRTDLLVLPWIDTRGKRWSEVAAFAARSAYDRNALLVVDTLFQFVGIRGDGENDAGRVLERRNRSRGRRAVSDCQW